MQYLFCRHQVADYAKWRQVFDSHLAAQNESGLHVLYALHDNGDPPTVVMLFRVSDMEKAHAFMNAPEAAEAARESGVIGTPEVMILTD